MGTTNYAVLVEYELPDDVPFDTAAAELMATLRESSPRPPVLVTTTAGPDAQRLMEARAGGVVASLAEQLHLSPGDVVVVTVPPERAPDDYRAIADAASVAFPDHQVVFVWAGMDVSAGSAHPVTLPDDVPADAVSMGADSVSGFDDEEVRRTAAYLIGGAETFLPVRDGEESAEWLYVQGMRRARMECERARQLLGHYPLCEALEHPEAVEEYCTCAGWAEA
ncbi:hypothetical protein [Amycolatopsis kentuckyensis]|uniref:hypothetical protein n=1 Tax=Amycolatopsis kentuckyensis TaxID=218823 RepID=UPI00356ABD8B